MILCFKSVTEMPILQNFEIFKFTKIFEDFWFIARWLSQPRRSCVYLKLNRNVIEDFISEISPIVLSE